MGARAKLAREGGRRKSMLMCFLGGVVGRGLLWELLFVVLVSMELGGKAGMRRGGIARGGILGGMGWALEVDSGLKVEVRGKTELRRVRLRRKGACWIFSSVLVGVFLNLG